MTHAEDVDSFWALGVLVVWVAPLLLAFFSGYALGKRDGRRAAKGRDDPLGEGP